MGDNSQIRGRLIGNPLSKAMPSFSDFDRDLGEEINENTDNVVENSLQKYRDGAHLNKPISEFGASKHLLRSESENDKEEGENSKSKNKSNNL